MIFTRSKIFLCKTEVTVLLKWEEGVRAGQEPCDKCVLHILE